ncbi:MAG: ATP-binding protein [Cyclobacteriaceae bacterium]
MWSTGNLACVAVVDNGVGIEMSRIESLFEVTGTKSTKGTNNEPGSGLGLVLCHEFIAKNDGHIWVKNNKVGDHFYLHTSVTASQLKMENR